MLEVRYEAGSDTFRRLTALLRRRQELAAPRWRRILLKSVGYVLITVFVAAPWGMTAPATPLKGLLTLYFIFAGALAGLAYMIFNSPKEIMLRALGAGATAEGTLFIDGQGVRSVAEHIETRIAWSGIDKVEHEDGLVLFHLISGATFALPLSAFPDKETETKFFELAASHTRRE